MTKILLTIFLVTQKYLKFLIITNQYSSNDLDVWENMHNYFSEIEIIEVNATITPGIIFRYSNKILGNSFNANVNV
jgi:hypothetical protein